MVAAWASVGARYLPFADAATPDLPLSRLLRLSLFQVSVGMAIVMLVGTLNRVMIVELHVPSSLVAVMVGLPLFFAPLRALIGFRSDKHRSELGWRRVPYIWMGTLIQFGGFAIMPFALLVLAGMGQAAQAPVWYGWIGAGGAFLLVGAGMHTVQTVGLALATDLAPKESQPKVVGLMYVMLLVGMIGSAFFYGQLLADFSPGRLIQVVQGAALITMVLNVTALWKQEARRPSRHLPKEVEVGFRESWAVFAKGGQAIRRMLVLGFGTVAFSMEDVLLEPYGGEILGLSVSATTTLTATLALGGLTGFGWASRVLSRGADPFRMANGGIWIGIPAFSAVILSAPLHAPWLFALGTFMIGLGAGLFGHGTLTSTMNRAPKDQTGLALGTWGAVQATGAGLAMAFGGILRDSVASWSDSHTGYDTVYGLEILLLVITLIIMVPLLGPRTKLKPQPQHVPVSVEKPLNLNSQEIS
jgi:BCD family chlorophyll transporter-like MFS transporter